MFITKAIAARIESCNKNSHIEMAEQYSCGRILELSGGVACFSGFESFFSEVVAWGLATKPAQLQHDISKFEQFYKALHHSRVDIDICPYVGNGALDYLGKRGYKPTEMNNVSVIDLKNHPLIDTHTDNYDVRLIEAHELRNWAKRVALGFGTAQAEEQFFLYASAPSMKAFGVFMNENLVAGAALAEYEEVCDLGVTSTLHAYRGQGLQKQLLAVRLNYAKNKGLSLATVTTKPSTISDLNIQKMGFRTAYTRVKMTLENPPY